MATFYPRVPPYLDRLSLLHEYVQASCLARAFKCLMVVER